MSLEVGAIVLFAAALHAGWNALIKIRGDRLIVMAVVTLAGSVISLALLPFIQSPHPVVWPLLALTILLHTGYHLFLPIAYDHGDLGQVYPIARGSAPLLVALGAFVLVGETLGPVSLGGVLCLAAGVISLTFDRKSGFSVNPKAILYALVTGVFIASYTVVDGLGVRGSGSILGFAVWLTLGDGVLTAVCVYCWKGNAVWRVARQNLGTAFLGGAMQGRGILDHRLGARARPHGHGLGSSGDKRSFRCAHLDVLAEGRLWSVALRLGRTRDFGAGPVALGKMNGTAA